MSKARYIRLEKDIQEALGEKPKRDSLYRAMKRGRDSRSQTISAIRVGDFFREEVREIKLRCQDCQSELIERFTQNAEKRGTKVFHAKDGQAAIEHILKLAQDNQVKTISKSKSLTSEEIEVNHPLEDAGIQVIETDLGELIIQLVDEKPYHLVFPSVHKTAVEVAEIFKKETGEDIPSDPKEIMKVVRRYLRPIFLNADIGMTGANIGIAETGAIAIETNEGNARLVSSISDIHVCIMGIEKIVDTFEDALMMMLAHPVSATGQHLTTYVTLMAGRSPLGEGAEKPRESHLVLLDNGRTEMREDPVMNDALNCIRCGACMNICPTYGVVGGHTFGHIYPGPIGIPWTAGVHGLDKAGDFASLCISCGLCKEICPADIDIPMMIAEVKHRDMEDHPQPLVNKAMMQAEQLAKMGSATAPLSNWMLNNGAFRWLLEKTIGMDRRRDLPSFDRNNLRKRFNKRQQSQTQPKHKIAFFADIYAYYNSPELGMAAIQHLEQLGCEVVLPEQKSSGYPYIGYGDLDKARQVAQFNIEKLLPFVEQGHHIITPEPTAAYCLKKSYPTLLSDSSDAKRVADTTYELFDYLLTHGAGQLAPNDTCSGKKFGFHVSCHQRPLTSGQATMDWLKQQGADIELVETGTCCGMAGTFGLKAGALGYGLSQAVGEPLFEAFAKANVDAVVTESSVCRIQLKEGTKLEVYHPLELLV